MPNIYTMESGAMRALLVKIKSIVDANGPPAEAVSEIQDLLDIEQPLIHDPYPFPEHIPDPRQLKIVYNGQK